MKIPESITIGGVKILVSNVPYIEDGALGKVNVAEGCIKLADEFGHNHTRQCPDSKRNTFFHELTHAVLETMGEFELTNNEKFVSTFSSLLTEALTSANVCFDD